MQLLACCARPKGGLQDGPSHAKRVLDCMERLALGLTKDAAPKSETGQLIADVLVMVGESKLCATHIPFT